jgi:gliding motility-associated-like protein
MPEKKTVKMATSLTLQNFYTAAVSSFSQFSELLCRYRLLIASVFFYTLPALAFGQSGALIVSDKPTQFCEGGKVTLSVINAPNPVTYKWLVDGVIINDSVRSSLVVSEPGVYTAIVTTPGFVDTLNNIHLSVFTKPGTQLLGTGSTIINGEAYFKLCSAIGQNFSFANNSSTASANTKYIIRWGDGTPDFVSSDFATPVNHLYPVGLRKLTFIVYSGSCVDSAEYKIFVGNIPAGGLVGVGGSTLCSGNEQEFVIAGTKNNPPGTMYIMFYNDGSKRDTFYHPAPDTVRHVFPKSSCGFNSSNGTQTFPNSYGAFLTIVNPCGVAGGSILPIYVSDKPKAQISVSPGDTACVNQPVTFTNTTTLTRNVVNGVCTPVRFIWRVRSLTTGGSWTLTSGSLGRDNGSPDPNLWTAGSSAIRINFTNTGTYAVKLVMINSTLCGADSTEKIICVNPLPTASFTTSSVSGCAPFIVSASGTTNAAFCGENLFNWSVVYTKNNECKPDTSSFAYINNSNRNSQNPTFEFKSPGTYRLRLQTTSPGRACSSAIQEITIEVKEKPVLSLLVPSQHCQNEPLKISAASACFTSGSSYNWTLNGATPSSGTSLNPDSITYQQPGSYSIRLSATNECGTTDSVRQITIKPKPDIQIPSPVVICNQQRQNVIRFTGSITGTRFNWTNDNPSIGLLSSGTDSIPSFIGVNNGAAPITATITITPFQNGCTGDIRTFTITVLPTPSAPVTQNVTYCQGDVASGLTAQALPGHSLRWYNTLSGGAASTQAPLPETVTPGSFLFFVSQVNDYTGCESNRSQIQVTVKPKPVISVSGINPVQCAMPNGGIRISGLPVSASLQVTYLENGTLQTVTGVTSANGEFLITGLKAGMYEQITVEINGCFSNPAGPVQLTDPSAPAQPVVSNSGPYCSGDAVLITVKNPVTGASYYWNGPNGFTKTTTLPELSISSSTANDAGIYTVTAIVNKCSSQVSSTTVIIRPSPGKPVTDTTLFYCKGTNATALTAESLPDHIVLWYNNPTGGNGTKTAPVPSTQTPGTYYFYVSQKDTIAGCESPRSRITVTIGPRAEVTDTSINICSGQLFTVSPEAPAGTLYSWDVPEVNSRIDGANSGTAESSITGQLFNISNTEQTAFFNVRTVTGTCIGSEFRLTVRVHPKPHIQNKSRTICSGEVLTIADRDSVPGDIVPAGTQFIWSTPVSNPSGVITGAAPSSGKQSILSQTLTNTTNGAAYLTYHIVPFSTGLLGCAGDTFQVVVKVNPRPKIPGQTVSVCSRSSFYVQPVNNPPVTIVPPGTKYTWSAPVVTPANSVTGATAETVPQDAISQSLTNKTTGTVLVVYTVTPVYGDSNSCAGEPFELKVLVNPQPGISDQKTEICSGEIFSIIPAGTPVNTHYTWDAPVSVPAGAITGGSAQSIPQLVISQELHNITNRPAQLVYRVRPATGVCESSTFEVAVTVFPKPLIPDTMISVCSNSLVSFQPENRSPFVIVPGHTKYIWGTPSVIPAGSISGITTPATPQEQFTQTLVNNTQVPVTVTYDVIPVSGDLGNCKGKAFKVRVLVLPDAKAAFSFVKSNSCAPFLIDSTVIKNQSSQIAAKEFQWFVNNQYTGTGVHFPGYKLQNPDDSVLIKMIAVSAFGCRNDSITQQFTTRPLPQVSFTASKDTVCGPATIQFVNQSYNRNGFRFLWNFGNGVTSALYQPEPVLFQPAVSFADTTYKITLQVYNECDTVELSRIITVRSKPKARFMPNRTNACSPASIIFTNLSQGINNQYVWNFKDGTAPYTTSVKDTISHVYNTGAVTTYRVQLSATNHCGSDTAFVPVVIRPNQIHLEVEIDGNYTKGCAPFTVKLINKSSGSNSYKWDLGDGTILFTTKGRDTLYHTYVGTGSFDVNLYSSNGCSDTSTYVAKVSVFAKPAAAFTANKYSACIGDSIQFTNQSSDATSYIWRFTPSQSSTATHPVVLISGKGSYQVQLSAFRSYGAGIVCSDTSIRQIVIRDTLPLSFSVSNTNGFCTPFKVVFRNSFKDYASLVWDFGDGTYSYSDTAEHTYTRNGIYKARITVKTPGGCIYTGTQIITVSGPQGTVNYRKGNHCLGTPVSFTAISFNTDSVRWNFGDGTIITTAPGSVSHTYTRSGVFVPKILLISQSGCTVPVDVKDTIWVDEVRAGFRFTQSQSCGFTDIRFADTSSSQSGIRSLFWNTDDGKQYRQSNFEKKFEVSGNYRVQLISESFSGCKDTSLVTIPVFVKSNPVTDITGKQELCTATPALFTASVQSADSISNHTWQLSNGVFFSGASFQQVFKQAGTYTLKLITRTVNNCYDTIQKQFTVLKSPDLQASKDALICKGKSITLSANGANSYSWYPNEGLNCSQCPGPVASPLFTTQYIVKGTAVNGCALYDTVLVTVAQPFKLTVGGGDSICIGKSTQLTASGALNYNWIPATGLNNSNIQNPVATPAITTNYMVVGSDNNKCFTDTGYVKVHVGVPPTVRLGPDLTLATGTQLPLNTTVTNGPIRFWNWSPATDLSCSNCSNPVATIKNNIRYTVTATSYFGCTVTDTIQIQVFCNNAQVFVPNGFSPDNDGVNDVLLVRAQGIRTVKQFRIFNRWGQTVFERYRFPPNDLSFGWDGKVNGKPEAPSVFVYTLEVECDNGTTYTYKGNITLIR